MHGQMLVLEFELETLDAALVVDRIRATLSRHGISSDGFTLYGQPVRLEQAKAKALKSRRPSFHLVGRGFEFHLSRVANHRMDVLEISVESTPRVPWIEFVSAFIETRLVMGWVADAEYDFWQNAEDPLHYKTHGRPFAHLPMRSNGLPPPLEQAVVDISDNPGRRVLRDGYSEAVGSPMWLGARFFALTGADASAIRATNWLKTSTLGSGVLEIQASEGCFRTAEGSEAETQRKLRKLLFPS